MGLTAFIQRDVVQYILPGMIALGLFLPFIIADITVTQIVFGGVILGFVLYPIAEWLSDFFIFELADRIHLPFSTDLSNARNETAWWEKNLDFNQLWYLLTKDEKEYLYGSQSYYRFYQLTAFYLLGFATVNLLFTMTWTFLRHVLGIKVAIKSEILPLEVTDVWLMQNLVTVIDRMLLSVVTAVLAIFCARAMCYEYKSIFSSVGGYIALARIYQKREGGLALAVWGWVLYREGRKPIANAELCLSDPDAHWAELAKTDARGRWQFTGPRARGSLMATSSVVRLSISYGSGRSEYFLTLGEKILPEFEIFVG